MSTHAILEIKDGKKTIAKAYKQMDGQPCHFGKKIKAALDKGCATVSGERDMKATIPQEFDGLECMAAYLVGKLKGRNIGDFLLISAEEEMEDVFYFYVLTADKKGRLHIEVDSAMDGTLYEGPLADAEMEKWG